jgi:hypothetical protein
MEVTPVEFQELKRRLAIVTIPEDALRTLLRVPEGCAIYGMWYDIRTMNIRVAIASMDFDAVPDGVEAPSLQVNMNVVECDDQIHQHLEVQW